MGRMSYLLFRIIYVQNKRKDKRKSFYRQPAPQAFDQKWKINTSEEKVEIKNVEKEKKQAIKIDKKEALAAQNKELKWAKKVEKIEGSKSEK